MENSKRIEAWPTALTLVGLIALGVGLRALALGEESAWGDEALTTVCFPNDGFVAYLRCVFAEDDRLRLAPLYYGVQFAWSCLWGGELVALRALSIFLGALASFQLFFLVTSMSDRKAGLWAVLLFNLSLFEIYYGQEVRFYALMNVFALAAIQGARWYTLGRHRSGLALAFVANAGLVWAHTFAVVFVLGLGLYMLRYWRDPRKLLPWFGAHSALAVGLFGWMAWLSYDFDGQSEAYGDMPAGLRELANTYLQFSGGRFSNMNPGEYLPGGVNLELAIAILVLFLVGFAVMRSLFGKAHTGPSSFNLAPADTALLLICLITPVILLYVLGRAWRPVFFTRYVIYAALPLYALAGIGLAQLPHRMVRRVISLALILLFSWQILALPRPFRADYGAVARAVKADPASDRVVLALKPFNYDAVAYAIRDTGVEAELLYGLKETVGIAVERASAGKSVWIVFYRWDNLDGFETPIREAGFVPRRLDSTGMPPLNIYHVSDVEVETPPMSSPIEGIATEVEISGE